MQRQIPKDDIRLKRLPSYIKYTREQGEPATIVLPGYFYTYNYRFNLNPNFHKLDFDEVRFYDWFPLTFIYDGYKNKEGKLVYRGLNFHHLPVRARRLWLTRLRKYIGEDELDNNERIIKMIDYKPLFYLFRKATFGIRNYRRERMFNIRKVPTHLIDDYMSFASKTYFAATLSQVGLNYKDFIPKNGPSRSNL
jgi:hypothetical protein